MAGEAGVRATLWGVVGDKVLAGYTVHSLIVLYFHPVSPVQVRTKSVLLINLANTAWPTLVIPQRPRPIQLWPEPLPVASPHSSPPGLVL